jgi:hypothetical protein
VIERIPLPESLQPSSDDRLDLHVRLLRQRYPTKVFDSMGRELKDRGDPQTPIKPEHKS